MSRVEARKVLKTSESLPTTTINSTARKKNRPESRIKRHGSSGDNCAHSSMEEEINHGIKMIREEEKAPKLKSAMKKYLKMTLPRLESNQEHKESTDRLFFQHGHVIVLHVPIFRMKLVDLFRNTLESHSEELVEKSTRCVPSFLGELIVDKSRHMIFHHLILPIQWHQQYNHDNFHRAVETFVNDYWQLRRSLEQTANQLFYNNNAAQRTKHNTLFSVVSNMISNSNKSNNNNRKPRLLGKQISRQISFRTRANKSNRKNQSDSSNTLDTTSSTTWNNDASERTSSSSRRRELRQQRRTTTRHKDHDSKKGNKHTNKSSLLSNALATTTTTTKSSSSSPSSSRPRQSYNRSYSEGAMTNASDKSKKSIKSSKSSSSSRWPQQRRPKEMHGHRPFPPANDDDELDESRSSRKSTKSRRRRRPDKDSSGETRATPSRSNKAKQKSS